MDNILFIGDSHIFHCFSGKSVDGIYLIDITLNKIRKTNCNPYFNYLCYDEGIEAKKYEFSKEHNQESLIDIINNSDKDIIVLSIGEIDVRCLLEKQYKNNKNCFADIVNVYQTFLNKIFKNKKIVVCSLPPPGIDNSNIYTQNILFRKNATKEMNGLIQSMCIKNNFIYFNIYDNFQMNGLLRQEMSHDGLHINKIFKSIIHKHLLQVLNKL